MTFIPLDVDKFRPVCFFVVFQLFVSWTFFFKYALLVWNLTKDFFSSTVNISFAKDGHLTPTPPEAFPHNASLCAIINYPDRWRYYLAKFIDIQWNKHRNRVGRLHFVHDVTLFCRSFTSVRLVCFVSHSNDMTSWLSNFFLVDFWYCEDLLIIPDLKYLYCDMYILMNYLLNLTCPKSLIFPKSLFLGFSKHTPRVPTSYL
jgi:hypothetical protein